MTAQSPPAPAPHAQALAPAPGALRPDGPSPSRNDLLQQSRKLQQLIEQAQQLRDPVARALVHECLQAVLAFYGDGLGRLLQVVQGCGPDGQRVFDRLGNDAAVRALLLIHGLHPLDLPARLRQAIEKVRPYMESHGGNVELLSLEDDFARLRLQGACKTCPSSAITLELALRHAIEEACPDLAGFEVEGVESPTHDESGGRHVPASRQWASLEGLPELRDGDVTAWEVEGVPLVVSRLNGSLYAYRNTCPACGQTLAAGPLEGGRLRCPNDHRYDVRQAGRDAGSSERHLEPFPLVIEEGVVKVAIA